MFITNAQNDEHDVLYNTNTVYCLMYIIYVVVGEMDLGGVIVWVGEGCALNEPV